MIRVRVETSSTAARAGIEALLRDEPTIEIVDPRAPAEVVIREDLPLGDDAAYRHGALLPRGMPQRPGMLHPEDSLPAEDASGAADIAGDLPTVVLTDDVSPQEALRSGARAALPRSASRAANHRGDPRGCGRPGGAAGREPADAFGGAPRADRRAAHTAGDGCPRDAPEGLSNKLIADRLSISEHTAKFHVNSILAKLEAGTRTEAVMRGLRLGLIKIFSGARRDCRRISDRC